MSSTPNVSTYELPQLVDLIKRNFDDYLESMDWQIRKSGFVVEETLPMHTGVYQRYAEAVNIQEYASSRPEGDQAREALVQYGYEKDLQVNPFALKLGVTKLMRDGGKNRQVEQIIDRLASVVPNRIELDLSHRFTFMSSTSYVNLDGETVNTTTGDGKALQATDHTLTGSTVTYSTVIPGNPIFSEGALEAAEKQFAENTYNNLGQKMYMKPTTILTTDDPNTINQVRRLLNATADVSSANSGTFNVYKNKYKVVSGSRIATLANGNTDSTKAKYWGLIAENDSDFHLTILNQPYVLAPTQGNNGVDISTETWTWLAGGCWGICTVTPKWGRFSQGNGS